MNTSIQLISTAASRARQRTPQRIVLIPLLVAAVGLANLTGVMARENPGSSKEYQVKAACLFNFAMFVEWPASAFVETNSPLCIGILGTSPFGNALAQVVEGECIKGRKLEIKAYSRIEDVKGCHLLFVSRSEKSQMARILSSVAGSSLLTVSEIDGFCASGGIINFFLQENKVRFEINPGAARQAGLRISAQLLHLSRIVGEVPAKETP